MIKIYKSAPILITGEQTRTEVEIWAFENWHEKEIAIETFDIWKDEAQEILLNELGYRTNGDIMYFLSLCGNAVIVEISK